MSSRPTGPITQLLEAVGHGDADAQEKLWAAIYDELHAVAHRQMASEASRRTLQTTVLVNEAYLRLVGDENIRWSDRRHFFAAAAKAMRRIRIDDARKRRRLKRGGGRSPKRLEEPPAVFDEDPAVVLAINEVLTTLEQVDPRRAELVMLRYFAGLSVDETADALGVSPRTVDSEWRFAKAWLHRELSKGDTTTS